MTGVLARLTRSWPLALWLTAVWVGLWGSVTVANVAGGLAVSLLLLAALPLNAVDSHAVVRPVAVLRLVGFFAVDLVKSSVQVVVLTLRPRGQLRQAVVSVTVPGASDSLLTLLANVTSLTPGTLTLEVDRPSCTLYVHVIDVGDGPEGVQAVRDGFLRTARLAVHAVGSADVRADLVRTHLQGKGS